MFRDEIVNVLLRSTYMFADLKQQRNARMHAWGAKAEQKAATVSREELSTETPAQLGSCVVVRTIPGRGRGLVASVPFAPGDTIFALDSQASTLSTQQLRERCHFCFSKGKLQRCSACRFARYCTAECQRAAWRTHRDECAALRRWFAHAHAAHPNEVELIDYEPGTAVRALALILWDMQRNGQSSSSWREFQTMQSHYGEFVGAQRDNAAKTAYRLARYAWGDEKAPLDAADLIRAVLRVSTILTSTIQMHLRSLTHSSIQLECASVHKVP